MKRNILTIAALCAAALSASAQTDVLYVQDATTYYEEFKVSDVSEFDAANPMTITFTDGSTRTINDPWAFWFGQLAALSNQYEYTHGYDETYNGIHDLASFRAVQHYNPLTQAVDSTDYHLDDIMVLHVNSENELPYVSVAGELFKVGSPDGFRLTRNRLNDNISMAADVYMREVDESKWYGGGYAPRLRLELTADPLTTYASEQRLSVSSFQTDPFSGTVGTVLYKPVVGIGGGSPVLVIGDAIATDAEGMRQGHYALEVSLAGNRFKNGKVDLSETDSYSITLYDYAEGKTKEITSHYKGYVTTLADPEKDGENIYLNIDFDAEAGTHFKAEYFGPLTTVDNLEGLAPQIEETNNVILTNDKGVQTLNQEITSMQLRESNDGTYYLYMMTDGTRPDDAMQNPCIQISPAHVNAGELSLPDLTDQWSVSFKSINVAFAKTEWHPAITNGRLNVKRTDDGRWDVTVDLRNEYNNMGSLGGDGTSLTIHYAGEASAYTGTKK